MYQSAAVSVMDARTGFVIYENAQHELMYPASITKIMTALLVLEEVENLQEQLIFSENSIESLPYYASRMHALPGDTLTVYEALYGLMLPSGNDVANALAEHVSGSIPAFVSHMNRRAAEIGAVDTHFINPCGLPGEGQHTTAFDMALIMREAINNPAFVRIISAQDFFIPPTLENFPEGWLIQNTNLLIQNGYFYNPWVIGGKTGFTNAAQHTLVSYARRGEHELIVSVLYAPRRATFSDTTALLNHTFAMPIEQLFESDSHYWQIPVLQEINGESEVIASITARGRGDFAVPMPDGLPAVRYEVSIPEYLAPPVRVGDVIGHKAFYAGHTLIGRVEIVSENSALPRIITEPSQPAASVPVFMEQATYSNFFNFWAFFPVLALVLIGFVVAMIRRHRKILRRRRRIARVRYARYHNNYY